MNRKRVVIFVEGGDDQRFFEKVIKPKLEPKIVEIRSYANLKKLKLKSFVHSLNQMGVEFYFTADLDQSPCVASKKKMLVRKHPFIKKECILIVNKEIESWYLAGLNTQSRKKFGASPMGNTEMVGKEEFNKIISRKRSTRLISMIEILDGFSFSEAKMRNYSFGYVMQKLV